MNRMTLYDQLHNAAITAEVARDARSTRDEFRALDRRVEYLEGQLRRIAHGNWNSPPVDSASAHTYAQIVNEMQNIAALALTAIVTE